MIEKMMTPVLPRRRFVQGLALSGAALGLAANPLRLLAEQGHSGQPTLQGQVFDLRIGETGVNFTGKSRSAVTVNGSLPAPILRWREGDTVTLRVTNMLRETTSIHWHGMVVPPGMDGVPGISFNGIAPGQTFTYQFPVRQNGTYWYHSHSGFQEQSGLYGPIVIDPAEPDPVEYDRDYVVMLSDWSDEDPARIYSTLKKLSHYYNFSERTLFDVLRDIREKGLSATWEERKMWNLMRMSQSDLSDVTGYTYTFLMNGHSPAGNWTGLFNKGEKVRLRFINAAAMSYFDVRVPGLDMTVVAVDGQNVEPVSVEEFRIGVAETVDVVVRPSTEQAYSIFAQAIDRSGYACGTLTPDPAMTASVPDMDPQPVLGHREMGMGHGAMAVGGMAMGDMSMGDMAGMNHTQHTAMTHGGHTMAMPSEPVKHATTEYGPAVDMRAEMPMAMLDDPGVGLRNNGRRVLTYADLQTLGGPPDSAHADREIELHLTGNMERYMWSFDGIRYSQAEPIALGYGERVRVTLVNDTMMHHPIHLHGMWSDIELGHGRLLRKHTVTVKPGERLSYLVRADARGGWAFHCHLMYHMAAGMFRKVVVS